jgi:hypothetical protein
MPILPSFLRKMPGKLPMNRKIPVASRAVGVLDASHPALAVRKNPKILVDGENPLSYCLITA